MITSTCKIAVGILSATLLSAIVHADDVTTITVQASRGVVKKTIDHTASGVPIVTVSLSYGVATAGLNLASYADVMVLETRVRSAANAACAELGRQFPPSTSDDKKCAEVAADKAIARVRELAAAAGSKPST